MKTVIRFIYTVVALMIVSACANMGNTTDCATPTLTPRGGTYPAGTLSVTIQTTTAGAYLCYTTDGTTPTDGATPHGKVVQAQSVQVPIPCVFGRTMRLQAIAFKPGVCVSPVAIGDYVGQ